MVKIFRIQIPLLNLLSHAVSETILFLQDEIGTPSLAHLFYTVAFEQSYHLLCVCSVSQRNQVEKWVMLYYHKSLLKSK